jgi:arylsulfatase
MGTLAFNNLPGIGRSGVGVLKMDGQVVAEQKMERTIPLILQWDEGLDVGSGTLTGVEDRTTSRRSPSRARSARPR